MYSFFLIDMNAIRTTEFMKSLHKFVLNIISLEHISRTVEEPLCIVVMYYRFDGEITVE